MKKPEKPPVISTQEFGKKLIPIFDDSKLYKKLKKLDGAYPYWDTFKYKVKDLGYQPSVLWKFITINRDITAKFLAISDISGFAFKYNTPESVLRYLHEFDMNLGGRLEGGSIIPKDEKNRFLLSSIMEEAIASSQLEGAVTSREVAKEMLRSERKPRDQSEKMILNNYLTIKKIVQLKGKILSPEIIKEIHATVTRGTLSKQENEGEFRKNNDVMVVDETNEIFYTPPDYKTIKRLLDDFCEFANEENNENFIHPIIKAIILHFLIGYIHPFVDGNGRTARAIFYWYLVSKGYWLTEYLSISRIIIKSRAKYARAYLYTEYDNNDLTYFIHYNLRAMDLALKSLKEYIGRKLAERKSLFDLVTKQNINERQAEIIQELISDEQKMLTINEVKSKFNVVYQTARTDLIGLKELGYLQERVRGKKILFFRSETFLSKIEEIQKRY